MVTAEAYGTLVEPEVFDDLKINTLEGHYKVGKLDGVGLQVITFYEALNIRGVNVHLFGEDVKPGEGLQDMAFSFQTESALALRSRIFQAGSQPGTYTPEGSAYYREILERAEPLEAELERYIDTNDINIVHIHNIMSLPYALWATTAFYKLAIKRPDIGFLVHVHDTFTEGPNAKNFNTPYLEIAELMDEVLMPKLPNFMYTTINTLCAEDLLEQRGIEASTVPDALDFSSEEPPLNEEAFRSGLKVIVGTKRPITANDVLVGLPMRPAVNKNWPAAVQLLAAMNAKRSQLEDADGGVGRKRRQFGSENRLVLTLTNLEDLQENLGLFWQVMAYAEAMGITVAYPEDLGDINISEQTFTPGASDIHQFYQRYQAFDYVVLPSEWEGYGNQMAETVRAKIPFAMVVHKVARRDIEPLKMGFQSLSDPDSFQKFVFRHGNSATEFWQLDADVLQRASQDAINVLRSHGLEAEVVEDNYRKLKAVCDLEIVIGQYLQMYFKLSTALKALRRFRQSAVIA